jgi:hypothetical protein
MKGIIFNLLEQFITKGWGEEQYDAILTASSLTIQDPFVGPGTYSDADFMILFGKAVAALGLLPEEGLRRFGRFAFPQLAARFPQFVTPYTHPKPFLKTVDSVIHIEVRKLYEQTNLPVFVYHDTAPNALAIEYSSSRRLCHFMEGLIDGVADHFQSPIRHQQSECLLRGDAVCRFDLGFDS